MATNGKKNHSSDGRKRVVKFKAKFSWKNLLLYGFLVIFSLFVFSALSSPYEDRKTVPLSEIIASVKKGQATKIVVTGDKLNVNLKNGTMVQAVKEPGADVYSLFKDAGANLGNTQVVVKDEAIFNNWFNFISAVLPVVLIICLLDYLFTTSPLL